MTSDVVNTRQATREMIVSCMMQFWLSSCQQPLGIIEENISLSPSLSHTPLSHPPLSHLLSLPLSLSHPPPLSPSLSLSLSPSLSSLSHPLSFFLSLFLSLSLSLSRPISLSLSRVPKHAPQYVYYSTHINSNLFLFYFI